MVWGYLSDQRGEHCLSVDTADYVYVVKPQNTGETLKKSGRPSLGIKQPVKNNNNNNNKTINPLDPQLAHSRVCSRAGRAADDVGCHEQLGFLGERRNNQKLEIKCDFVRFFPGKTSTRKKAHYILSKTIAFPHHKFFV